MTRLSISNIAWPVSIRDRVYAELAEANVLGLEVAPTKFANWEDLTRDIARVEGQRIRSSGLEISSYQALYFNRPDCQLLTDAAAFDAMRTHTVRVAAFAENLSGGGAGVFGAPRNRNRGALGNAEAFELGAERFRLLAEAVASTGFVIALEAAPQEYGGDFLQTTAACAAMVRAVNHPAFRLHIDSGCLIYTGENAGELISEYIDLIVHAHLSKPELAAISIDDVPMYRFIISALIKEKFNGWTAIEMREASDPLTAVREAIRVIKVASAEINAIHE